MFVLVATALASLFYVAKFHPQRLPEGLRFFGKLPPEQATSVELRSGLFSARSR